MAGLSSTLAGATSSITTIDTALLQLTTSLESTCVQLDTIGAGTTHCCRTTYEMFCLGAAAAGAVGMDVTNAGDCPDCPTGLLG